VDLSLILCTWNNSKRVRITLDSISRCTIPSGIEWELILVNNNCSDSTDEVAHYFYGKLPLVYIHEPRQGLSRARNAGLNAAAGNLVLFTDDDVMPCTNWIGSYWNAYQDKPKDYYFGGPVESKFTGERPNRELLSLAPYSVKGMDWGMVPKTLSPDEQFIAANWACPMKALKATGGFDVRLGLDPSSGVLRTGEEKDIMERLREIGLSPWYVPDAKIIHFVPSSKTTLKHIAAKAKARAYYSGTRNQEKYLQFPSIDGIPIWMFKDAVKCWGRWVYARSKGRKGYQEYVEMNRLIGIMKGLRKNW
jgi:glycosyltransferase involved in cell wall biosynthesis